MNKSIFVNHILPLQNIYISSNSHVKLNSAMLLSTINIIYHNSVNH